MGNLDTLGAWSGNLRLLDEHRFDNGVVYLRYSVEP
jgi:hypothetical protein